MNRLVERAWVRAEQVITLLNRVTEYDRVETAKKAVQSAESTLLSTRSRFKEAKLSFEQVGTERNRHQQDINGLLHRKPSWNSKELSEFTELCRVEHDLNNAFSSAKRLVEVSEEASERAMQDYLNALRNHYHQEQLWAEKGRRLSTYGTLALIGFNTILFIVSVAVIEPRKREAIAVRAGKETSDSVRRDMDGLEKSILTQLGALGAKVDLLEQVVGTTAVEEKSHVEDVQQTTTRLHSIGLALGGMVVGGSSVWFLTR